MAQFGRIFTKFRGCEIARSQRCNISDFHAVNFIFDNQRFASDDFNSFIVYVAMEFVIFLKISKIEKSEKSLTYKFFQKIDDYFKKLIFFLILGSLRVKEMSRLKFFGIFVMPFVMICILALALDLTALSLYSIDSLRLSVS